MPKTKNNMQNPKIAIFLYRHRTEIKIKPIITKPSSKIWDKKIKELIKIPPTKERQKYKNIFEVVIFSFYHTIKSERINHA